jgi:integral membrane protein (TIGR01906 family)
VDYLLNGEDITYLSDLRFPTGESMYTTRELRHMRDVKAVTQIAFLLASIMGITVSIIGYHLWRDSGKRRVLRRGLLDGSLLTLSIIATIIMVAIINWDQFFTAFHQVFFESGTWRFSYSDTLIRLFPEQFWFDAALTIGTLTSIGAGIILLITWRWNLTPGSADN